MAVWKFLHIVSMFAAVTLLFSHDVVFFRAARSGDVHTLRRIASQAKGVINIGIAVFFLGIGFGLVTALVGGIPLTAPWLLTAYGIVVVMIVLGLLVETPYQDRLAEAAERSGEEPSEELRSLLASPKRYWLLVSGALYVAVIFDMVVKPF